MKRKCPKCGNEMEEYWNRWLCQNCGTKIIQGLTREIIKIGNADT